MACQQMQKCKKCNVDKVSVCRRQFSCYKHVIICCFECANIPTCPCSGSQIRAVFKNSESRGYCAFCMEYLDIKLYDFQCRKVNCRRRLCKNCASEPNCKVCLIDAFILDEEKEWPEDRTTQLN